MQESIYSSDYHPLALVAISSVSRVAVGCLAGASIIFIGSLSYCNESRVLTNIVKRTELQDKKEDLTVLVKGVLSDHRCDGPSLVEVWGELQEAGT